ncbi:MAG: CoA ester lyase [Rhizobiaceae bacterium]
MRSWLFVPGDSEKKLAKGLDSGADALIIDLEDSVAASSKQAAREICAAFLTANRDTAAPVLFVRVNAFDTGLTTADLEAVMPAAPAGIVLPKAEGRPAAERLSDMLDGLEADCGLHHGATRILPIATETAASVLAAATWNAPLARLAGVTWGAEDLSADLGIANPRDGAGFYTDVFRHARAMTVLAAGGAQTDAIDTVFIDFRDEAGLSAECDAAARDGFAGKLAIHPAQVPVINRCFTPDDETIAEARAIVAAFAGAGDTGVTSIDGKMIDRPHLRRAERILARSAALSG